MEKILLVIFILVTPLFADDTSVKEKILNLEKRLSQEISINEKGELLFDLSKAKLLDQEIEIAFRTFLAALEATPKKGDVVPSKTYEEALAHYLKVGSYDPAKAASEIIEKYDTKETKDPNLRLLLSTSYGNLGKYDRFFEEFYAVYPHLSESFLAYKTKGVLCLRLSQMAKESSVRQQDLENALTYFSKALEKNRQDPTVYKALLFLAKELKKCSLVHSLLKTMVEAEAPILRNDLLAYVQEALENGDRELACRIVERGKSLYEYSRAVQTAEEYLKGGK